VTAADYPPFHRAMVESLRAARLNDRRYFETGLTAADADALIPHLVQYTEEPRTNAECEALLSARLGVDQPRAWWALRTFAPVVHAVTGGPWSFGYRPSYLAAPRADQVPDGRDAYVQWLAWRYLEGFGPASAADLAQFTLLTRSVAKNALDAMAGRLERLEGPDGTVLFDVPGAPLPGEDTPCPPRLMAMWDSVLLAYADRGRVIPPAYRALVIRRNGDVLPTLLVDGHVAGVWRPADGGIEATAFHELPERAWLRLADEARALVSFLAARDPAVYRRYAHWWKELPAAEVRVLAG
jgi:hypothetical protein